MQIPQQSGSPGPYAQADGDPRNSTPYPQYQHQPPPPGQSYQAAPYGQSSTYGPPPYHQSPPPGQPFQQIPPGAPYRQHPPYGQQPQYSHQQGYSSGYGQNNSSQSQHYGFYQNQHGSPPPNQTHHYPSGLPAPARYGAAADYHQQGPPQAPVPDAEEDRGLLGALAGGATGAWAGHKINHGFLGALGGAFAGHKLQDTVSDKKKKSKKSKKSHSSSSSSCCSSDSESDSRPSKNRPGPPKYAGNFSGSVNQITIDQDYDLIASCSRLDGSRKLSSINLNKILTNSDGHFKWSDEGNFGASARNVRLIDCGKVLEAELADCGGRWVWSRIVLDEQIGNNDGELVLVR